MSDKSSIIKETQKYLARGQIDKAIAEWEKLIKEYPDGNTYNTLGDLYLKKGDKQNAIDSFHKAANFFRHEGFSLKALALYKKILNINPSDPDSLFSLGELNEAKGLITDAMKFYLAAADNLSKEGKKEKLLEIYEKILALSPSNIPHRSNIAEIYSNEGNVLEAAKQ
ncbi:MAG: tetratricopeptide repeat protein [Nitrospirota bacterium]|nr:tetratricopeptide repeat protein [Nitrospirota bacterium]